MTTKFDLGEKVFGIIEEIRYDGAKCKYCKDGIIKLKGDDFLCPGCSGSGTIGAPTKYHKIAGPLTINRIIISRTEGIVYGFPSTEPDDDYCEFYIEENMIFKSKEEARDEITRGSEQ